MTPLVIQQFAIEAMAIEIVDLPTKNCGFSINHPFIDGFSIANHPFYGVPPNLQSEGFVMSASQHVFDGWVAFHLT
jgi:hypothetical protein